MGAVHVLKIHPGVKHCEIHPVRASAEGGLNEKRVYRLVPLSNLSIIMLFEHFILRKERNNLKKK